ncbi:hypothetical protein IWQ62_006026 [Dispira parvispora]|uniref:Uncharacterized protein n=1 Tax=Dispira parvispora TaxID=1520584 RepID=A0A9W8AIK8_9FUNG|nr:hypothetical protein IWQ62_006026 [Dispira parvispora]
MAFFDRFYQESRDIERVYVHNSAREAHPTFRPLPQSSTFDTMLGGSSSAASNSAAVTQSSGHHFIPVSVTSDSSTYERSQPLSRVPVKSNSLAAVSTDLNQNGGSYTMTLQWNGDKPTSVDHQVSGGTFGIHAVSQPTTTPAYTYVYEHETTDCFDRFFNLPEDADTSRYHVEYDKKSGRMTATFLKKKNQFASLFRS